MSVKPPELNCKLRFLIMPRDVCVQNLAAIIKVSDSYIGGRDLFIGRIYSKKLYLLAYNREIVQIRTRI